MDELVASPRGTILFSSPHIRSYHRKQGLPGTQPAESPYPSFGCVCFVVMDTVETLFSIPHIVTAIGANLRLQDLTSCARVSSSWYRLFSFELKLRDGPALPYSDNIVVDNNIVWIVSRNQSSSLTREQAQNVNMTEINKNTFIFRWPTVNDAVSVLETNVHGSEQEQGGAFGNEGALSSPLSLIPDPEALEDTAASRAYWRERLSKVRALAYIVIHTVAENNHESRRPTLAHILGRLPSTIVSLNLTVLNDWNTKEAILDMTPFEPWVYESLVTLRLDLAGNLNNDKRLLDWFLRRCPALYQLDYISTSSYDSLPALDLGQCSKLEHLTIDGEMEPRDFLSMVHSVPRLKAITLIGTPHFKPDLWQALLPHSRSLESIRLQGTNASSGVISSILQNWAGLQHFSAVEDDSGHLGACLELSDMFSSPWVWTCLGLKTLSLHLLQEMQPTITPQENAIFTNEALNELSVKYPRAHKDVLRVYLQLSLLTELESLQVFMVRPPLVAEEDHAQTRSLMSKNEKVAHAVLGLDYSIESGLELLSPLKKLRRLEIQMDEDCPEYAARIGQAEVEWMAENWPSLSLIQYGNKDDDLGETTGPLNWLQGQLPGLEIAHVPRRVTIETCD
ncbi:hypothetical protein EMPS_03687 [Entomortierella parvispora]|uniref:F-box domain-containing protein n=1 Tax=Entomortierella parvispora TaxID=205924 RepID=A0A9P3H784_9FUNG|nr:hypothetical protein EMPS_03687 [Entomortierella parvispora]